MNKKTLTLLFAEYLFQIPDYQRGYAWEEKQLTDFIQDIDALVAEKMTSHYTGTVVVYAARNAEVRVYGTKRLKVVDVVDGQQRLTTSCLYLSVIIRALLSKGEAAYEREIPDFLYSGADCKLRLNNDTGDIFYDIVKTGRANTPAQSPHEMRLIAAYTRLQEHIDKQLAKRGTGGVAYLKEIYNAVTQQLHFTFYMIEEECEIGMTFELMNSRGKGLSVLELLKNYLMHWVSRNEKDAQERNTLTRLINKNWKGTYTNLGSCAGDEDQCLRIAWTLYCNHSPKNWIGYDGFKGDDYIPLRNFAKRTKPSTKAFIATFADGLAKISVDYASVTNPTASNTVSRDELLWLTKIHHTGNIANFLPLMVAARKHREGGSISEADYIALLKALESFAYRVFLRQGRRSNAGKSSFHRWGFEIFTQIKTIRDVTAWVYDLTRYYAPEESFSGGIASPSNWYGTRHLLKYTLFEYELHLLATEGQGKTPHLKWEQLRDSTIEHILPQTPEENSHWKSVWSPDEISTSTHDIANLVLTQDNSSYSNFEFARKKGMPGQSPSYSNSDIRQERKLSSFTDWTPEEFKARRSDLVTWISNRWRTESGQKDMTDEIDEEEDVDGLATFVHLEEVAPL
jgi:hypothetical protein